MRYKTKRLLVEFCIVFALLAAFTAFTIPKFLKSQNFNNSRNFPDPAFREAIVQLLGEKFTESQAADISEVLSYRKDRPSIRDFTGIGFLRSIYEISIGNQKSLTYIDLSKNIGLRDIYLENNFAIKTIVFPHPSRVRQIHCHHNQMETLDVSTQTTLGELYCGDNLLTELDLSHNPELFFLGCDRNQLASLDFSNNHKLRYINCQNNKLAALDLSKNPALEKLICKNNLLTDLDLSNNERLTDLDLSGNQLDKIPDLSHLKQLQALDVRGNPLTNETQETIERLSTQLGPPIFYNPSINDGRIQAGFAHSYTNYQPTNETRQ